MVEHLLASHYQKPIGLFLPLLGWRQGVLDGQSQSGPLFKLLERQFYMKLLLPLLFHLLPLLPFAKGQIYMGLAGILIVALPYIKVAKLAVACEELRQQAGQGGLGASDQTKLRDLEVRYRRWESLTFRPWLQRSAGHGGGR